MSCYCPEGEGTDAQLSKRILSAARSAVKDVIAKAKTTGFDLGDRTGGYFFCLKPPFKGPLVYPTLIERIINGKDEKYRAFSQKKATDHMDRLDEGYELSSMFRDPEKDMFGGSVKGVEVSCGDQVQVLLFSFSGLPEMLDEAAMLLTAVRSGCMSIGHALELALISKVSDKGNTFFMENEWAMTGMIKCPGCDLMLPEDNLAAQIKHMEECHTDIIAKRHAGIERT